MSTPNGNAGRIGMTISANGVQAGSGILWETTGDYNAGTPGALHAYDASNLANEFVEQRHESRSRPDAAHRQIRTADGR